MVCGNQLSSQTLGGVFLHIHIHIRKRVGGINGLDLEAVMCIMDLVRKKTEFHSGFWRGLKPEGS